jgi:hypothetical protein
MGCDKDRARLPSCGAPDQPGVNGKKLDLVRAAKLRCQDASQTSQAPELVHQRDVQAALGVFDDRGGSTTSIEDARSRMRARLPMPEPLRSERSPTPRAYPRSSPSYKIKALKDCNQRVTGGALA